MPVPCTTGFYETIFNGDVRPSEDCVYAIAAPLQSRTEVSQDVGELNLQGGCSTCRPGRCAQRRVISIGAPRLVTARTSCSRPPSSPIRRSACIPPGTWTAQTTAQDVYAELLVPVLANFGVRKFELELGGRHSDYDQTDSTFTYKVLGNVELNDFVRFRGGFNRATRAPNLWVRCSCRCSRRAWETPPTVILAEWLPIPRLVPVERSPIRSRDSLRRWPVARRRRVPRARISSAARRWAPPVRSSSTPARSRRRRNLSLLIIQEGNPQLKSEKADTWTMGVVLQSPFERALLRNLTATLDWYSIEINDAILPYTVDYAGYLCYGAQPSDIRPRRRRRGRRRRPARICREIRSAAQSPPRRCRTTIRRR